MDIGTVIKERRAILGISQQDLSDYSGVGISTVKDLERGVANPSLQTLRKILDVVVWKWYYKFRWIIMKKNICDIVLFYTISQMYSF